jgi:hypothetical protein
MLSCEALAPEKMRYGQNLSLPDDGFNVLSGSVFIAASRIYVAF